MTTQYFLHRSGKACPTCHQDTVEPVIQIGHSAAGWVFMWRGWRDSADSPAGRPLDTPNRWREFLIAATNDGAKIKDEYGRGHLVEDFLRLVENKRDRRPGRANPPLRHSDLSGFGAMHVDGDDFAFREIG